jgi:hypothetical protein
MVSGVTEKALLACAVTHDHIGIPHIVSEITKSTIIITRAEPF